MSRPARNSSSSRARVVRAAGQTTPIPRDWTRRPAGSGRRRRRRRAFTLVELLIGMMLTSMLSLMLSAMILAVGMGWDHCTGLDEAVQHARVTLDRIQLMVSHAGVYRLPGEAPVLGVRVVDRGQLGLSLPEVLVVWSGGRMGGMAATGEQQRLPLINELVIYTPDVTDPGRLVEVTSPTNTSPIDLRQDITAAISAIVDAPDSERVLLSNRLRTSKLSSGFTSRSLVGAVRFEIFHSPTDAEIAAVSPGTAAWKNLVWSQGIASSSMGLRQTTVRTELQLLRTPHLDTHALSADQALSFLGTASRHYVYQP